MHPVQRDGRAAVLLRRTCSCLKTEHGGERRRKALNSISTRGRDKTMTGQHGQPKTKWKNVFSACRGGSHSAITSGENSLGRCRIFAVSSPAYGHLQVITRKQNNLK